MILKFLSQKTNDDPKNDSYKIIIGEDNMLYVIYKESKGNEKEALKILKAMITKLTSVVKVENIVYFQIKGDLDIPSREDLFNKVKNSLINNKLAFKFEEEKELLILGLYNCSEYKLSKQEDFDNFIDEIFEKYDDLIRLKKRNICLNKWFGKIKIIPEVIKNSFQKKSDLKASNKSLYSVKLINKFEQDESDEDELKEDDEED
jgi:hypothetical protein